MVMLTQCSLMVILACGVFRSEEGLAGPFSAVFAVLVTSTVAINVKGQVPGPNPDQNWVVGPS